MPPLAVIIPTHTPRHLSRALLGALTQQRPADHVILSVDNDREDIAHVAERAAAESGRTILLVQRPAQSMGRLAQVRNNAVRALIATIPVISPDTRLVFIDGDCFAPPAHLEQHERLGAPDRVVLGFRIDQTEAQTDAFDEDAARRMVPPVIVTADQLAALRRRARRASRQLLLRRLGLAKPHKPKMLGANFSLTLAHYRLVNGFDESYQGYGQEDDDFCRRLHMARAPIALGIMQTPVLHQHHPTRAPGAWDESPNAARFAGTYSVRAERGLENPLDQSEPVVRVLCPAPKHAAPVESVELPEP